MSDHTATYATQNGRAIGLEPATRSERSLARHAAAAGLWTILCVLVVALACRLFFAEAARRELAFTFDPAAASLGVAWQTLSTNLQLATVCFVCALVVSHLWCALDRGSRRIKLLYAATRVLFELWLGLVYVVNVLVVGISLGAYGTPMVRALLPHGPVELAAFSLALAAYLRSRYSDPRPGLLLRTWLAVTLLLITAAGLETWGAG